MLLILTPPSSGGALIWSHTWPSIISDFSRQKIQILTHCCSDGQWVVYMSRHGLLFVLSASTHAVNQARTRWWQSEKKSNMRARYWRWPVDARKNSNNWNCNWVSVMIKIMRAMVIMDVTLVDTVQMCHWALFALWLKITHWPTDCIAMIVQCTEFK